MSSKERNAPSRIAAKLVSVLMFGPKSLHEIAQIVYDRPDRVAFAQTYMVEFRQAGLVYVAGHNQHGHEVFSLQKRPFLKQDTPHVLIKSTTPVIQGNTYNGKYTVNGEMLTVKEAAKKYNIKWSLVRARLARGLTLEQAVTVPVRPRARWLA